MDSFDDAINYYVGIVDKVINFMPYKRMKTWREFFFNPSETISKNIGGYGNRIKDIYVMSLFDIILTFIMLLPAIMILGGILLFLSILTGGIALGVIAAIMVGAIVIFLLIPFIFLLYALLFEYPVAKIFGGKAGFRRHFNASVLPHLAAYILSLPLILLMIPFEWASMIPLASICISIVILPLTMAVALINFYGFYLKYLAFREIHKLSKWRGIGAVFIPIILFICALVAVVLLTYAALIALIAGISGATYMPGLGY